MTFSCQACGMNSNVEAHFPGCVILVRQENEILRGELSLAEEGLANYQQEVKRLRKELFMAHADLGQGDACGCLCDDCKAYMTGSSSEPQTAPISHPGK